MEVENYQAFKNWKEREIKCNNWLIKDGVYVPLPDLQERQELTQAQPYLFQFSIPKEKCIVVFDEKEISEIENQLQLRCENFVQYFASPYDFKHPTTHAWGPINKITVAQSSSFRSFFYDNYMIKVSHDKFQENHVTNKVLYSYQIERAVSISKYLNSVMSQDSQIQILKESFGCYLNDPQNPYGYIIRQIPHSVLEGKTSLISLVSYVSDHENGQQSLLARHLNEKKPMEVEKYLKDLISTITKAYLAAYWNYGVCLELHQQNTLLELDAQDQFTGKIYCRDLDGARLDMGKISSLGLEINSTFSAQESQYIFEHKKIDAIKNGVSPELKSSLVWNGLTIFAFRLYVVDSCFFLIDNFIKQQGLPEFDVYECAYRIVNEEILKK